MRTYLTLGLLLLAACVFAQRASAQSKNQITLGGSEYAFSISLPEKWNLDTAKLALRHLARAVVYPATGESHFPQIEILPATKMLEGINTLRNLLNYSAHFDSANGARHIENTPIETKDGKKVLVVTSAYQNWQTVNAYVEEAHAVIVFSLAVLDLKTEKEGVEALNEVVKSYSSLPPENGPKK